MENKTEFEILTDMLIALNNLDEIRAKRRQEEKEFFEQAHEVFNEIKEICKGEFTL